MKTIKLADLVTNLVLILGGTFYYIQQRGTSFMWIYSVVGGWQILSMFTHILLKDQYTPSSHRRIYQFTILVLFLLGLLSLLLGVWDVPLFIFYLYLMVFLPLILAPYYTLICLEEFKTLRRREFIHLK